MSAPQSLDYAPSRWRSGDPLIAYRYDPAGNLVATRDRNGIGYEFANDKAHRMVWRKGRQGFRFHFTYDDQGRCCRAVGDGSWYGVALEYKP